MIELLPHQVEAREWLRRHRRAYLADKPRTGKTYPTVLAACDVIGDSAAALVVCPANVIAVWEAAITALAPEDAHFTVTSYDMFRKQHELHAMMGYKVVVLDEAHKLKSLDAQITKLLLPIAARAEYVWPLSGTPMPNGNPGEMYTIIRALWPHLIEAGYYEWLDATCNWVNGKYGPKIYGYKNQFEFEKLLQGLPMMQREMVTPPPIGALPVRIVETKEIRELTALCQRAKDGELEKGERDPSLSTLRRLLGAAKVAPYLKVLEDERVRKRVIFAHHHDVLDALETGLGAAGVAVYRIDGATPRAKKETLRLAFQSSTARCILLGQLDAAREGIDLSSSDVLDILEPSWVPGFNTQAAMRIMNVNQLDTSTGKQVRFIYATETADEAFLGAIKRKERLTTLAI